MLLSLTIHIAFIRKEIRVSRVSVYYLLAFIVKLATFEMLLIRSECDHMFADFLCKNVDKSSYFLKLAEDFLR